MDIFLDSLENQLKSKNSNDNITNEYIDDINNLLVFPLISHFDMCEEMIEFHTIFNIPYDKQKYKKVFKELVSKITSNKTS